MKIKPEHFEIIKKAIEPHDTTENRAIYREGRFHKAATTKDVNKRYRWDLFWHAQRLANPFGPSVKWVCDTLYPYLDDDHIDTALRSIVKPLEA
jgi:hypothetical protein